MSTIKVNTIENRTGSTLTLGKSGTTIQMACGATQTGFGRSGSVNWQTTPKPTTFTAVNGEGYFVNTTSGAIEMTMPSGSAGAIVSIQDYNKTFDSKWLDTCKIKKETKYLKWISLKNPLMIQIDGSTGKAIILKKLIQKENSLDENESTGI